MAHLNKRTIISDTHKKIILSIDGGGMRGVIPLAMLAQLEEQSGTTVLDLFDMIVGTSTGAIIAIGLAIGYSPSDLLREVYRGILPGAFRVSTRNRLARFAASILRRIVPLGENFLTGLLTNRLRYAYALDPFREQLTPLLQAKGVCRLSDLKSPILLLTTKDVYTSDTLFIVNAGKGKRYFQDWPLAGIVAASGAAPLFFPPVLSRLVDGGAGAYANPCLAAAIEAMEYIGTVQENDEEYDPAHTGFHDGNVVLVSLGTGYTPTNLSVEAASRYRAANWLAYTVAETLDDAALQQVFNTLALYGKRSGASQERIDFRRYNPLLNATSVSEELGIGLLGRPAPEALGLDSYDDADIDLMEEIGRKYAQHIDWSKPGILPWDTIGGHHRPNPRTVFQDNMNNNPVRWDGTPYAC